MGGGTLFDYLAAAREEVRERHLSVVPSAANEAGTAVVGHDDVETQATVVARAAVEAPEPQAPIVQAAHRPVASEPQAPVITSTPVVMPVVYQGCAAVTV